MSHRTIFIFDHPEIWSLQILGIWKNMKSLYPPWKLTESLHLKMDGWKTRSFPFWVSAYFSGAMHVSLPRCMFCLPRNFQVPTVCFSGCLVAGERPPYGKLPKAGEVHRLLSMGFSVGETSPWPSRSFFSDAKHGGILKRKKVIQIGTHVWWNQTWCKSRWWFSNLFYFHPYLGKWSNLTHIFEMGWNHQPEMYGDVGGKSGIFQ